MTRTAGVVVLLLVAAPLAAAADDVSQDVADDSLHVAPAEPPPEAGDGDYTLEAADSLADEELDFALGASGSGRGAIRRSQRVSFRGGGSRGTLRDGDDALAGGRVEADLFGGTVGAGRMAPRWGRGLVLGGAADPWARGAADRGVNAAFRGRAGDGLLYEGTRASVLAGRFKKRGLAGARAIRGAGSAGVLASGDLMQASLAWDRDDHALEAALDRRGRWRAEALLTGDAGDTRLALRVRGGHGAFRPLAEPERAGPAEALAVSAARSLGAWRASAFASLWRWNAARDGGRAAVEATARLGPRGLLAAGVEQQHGIRRDPALSTVRASGPRQGLWCEWRGGTPAARLTLRDELWGTRAFARDAVRQVVVARADIAAARGARLEILHAVWRTRRGDNLYLPEAADDRLVLRALAGAGARTRAELRLPLALGEIRLGITLVSGGTRPAAPAWTVQWSRRSRWGTARARAP